MTTDTWFLAGILTVVSLTLLLLIYALATTKTNAKGGSVGADILERLRNEPALLGTLVGYILLLASHYKFPVAPTELEFAITTLLFVLTGITVRSKVSPVAKLQD